MLDYVAELRRLATYCKFGDYLDHALRDRLVCGIRSENIQKRLLIEAGLTLTQAVELAQGMEVRSSPEHSIHEGKDRRRNQ